MKHGLKAERFFTAEEKKRIRETTRDVESRTIGEIAVMVVESSDHYFEAEIVGAILLSSLLSLAVTVSYFHSSVWFYVPLNFLFFFPARLLFQKVHSLKVAFTGLHRREHAVRLRAVRAFYEKGLYKTRKNTGILFFISLFERKVRVLADSGIHEKIGQETLDRLAKTVSQGIRDGRASDALCEAIKAAGALLEKHFPLTPGDTNELSDAVMTE
ncbi:MAG TPA: TPM domain-containing protein [Thermodesulfovibrionales bacterium]|nr:TPM domain-containing protein [Thermodesulfovibrionales bacterium]